MSAPARVLRVIAAQIEEHHAPAPERIYFTRDSGGLFLDFYTVAEAKTWTDIVGAGSRDTTEVPATIAGRTGSLYSARGVLLGLNAFVSAFDADAQVSA